MLWYEVIHAKIYNHKSNRMIPSLGQMVDEPLEKDWCFRVKPGENNDLLSDGVETQLFLNSEVDHTLRSNFLSKEIIDSADFLFRQKGFEKTTNQEICNRLNISITQFYDDFESLDEVLEILWQGA